MSEPSKNAKKDQWVKENALRINVKINRKKNVEIVAALEQSGNMQGFIKEALRYYISHGCPRADTPVEEDIDFKKKRIAVNTLVK